MRGMRWAERVGSAAMPLRSSAAHRTRTQRRHRAAHARRFVRRYELGTAFAAGAGGAADLDRAFALFARAAAAGAFACDDFGRRAMKQRSAGWPH